MNSIHSFATLSCPYLPHYGASWFHFFLPQRKMASSRSAEIFVFSAICDECPQACMRGQIWTNTVLTKYWSFRPRWRHGLKMRSFNGYRRCAISASTKLKYLKPKQSTDKSCKAWQNLNYRLSLLIWRLDKQGQSKWKGRSCKQFQVRSCCCLLLTGAHIVIQLDNTCCNCARVRLSMHAV